MKFVISPAKSLDFETTLPTQEFTQPSFLVLSELINKTLAKKKPSELSSLMHISDKLSQLNWERNQQFSIPFTPENARPAVFAFSGDVYQGLEASTLTLAQLDQMQDQLYILSGLYGMLKPLDLIQPYRLEMGTSIAIENSDNLYQFWKETLTQKLNREMGSQEVLVNLASQEYFTVLDTKKLSMPIITPIFKDWKNEKLKIISFFAKKARGYMLRYAIENKIQNLEGLLGFTTQGYAYSAEETKDPMQPVFVR